MSENNESSPLRTFLFVLGALVAFTVIIMFTAGTMTEGLDAKRANDSGLKAVIADRIKPVGQVAVAKANEAPAAPKSGAEVVAASCTSCHGTGVLNAPKIGDAAVWTDRLTAEGGIDGLLKSAIVGKGSMPPKGGASVSDDELKAAILDMLKESGVEAAGAAAEAAPEPASPMKAATDAMSSMMSTAKNVAAEAVAPVVAAVTPAAPAVDLAKGKSVYASACFVCHGAGVAGAPKLGDKDAWAARLAQGMDAINNSALKGKLGMPPKGGRMDLSDDDVLAAAAYMVDQAK